jgi:hypothetical protein
MAMFSGLVMAGKAPTEGGLRASTIADEHLSPAVYRIARRDGRAGFGRPPEFENVRFRRGKRARTTKSEVAKNPVERLP